MKNEQNSISRRAALGFVASSTLAVACADDPAPTATADVTPLNGLLSAEYDAIKAYEAGLAILRSPPMGDPFTVLARDLARIATRWQSQHRDHATALEAAIRSNYGTPVREIDVMFTPPNPFPASIVNVLKLACNKERIAAIAYNDAVKAMRANGNRFLAGSIEGDETQHFIILHSLLRQLAEPGATILEADMVPTSFVSTVAAGTNPAGLQTILDFGFGAS